MRLGCCLKKLQFLLCLYKIGSRWLTALCARLCTPPIPLYRPGAQRLGAHPKCFIPKPLT